MKWGPSGWF